MLGQAIHRLEGVLPRENILVLTNAVQEDEVRAAIGNLLPEENIISEPERRDTAPAIAFAIGWIASRDPEASMAVLPSDHLINDVEAFQETLAHAFLTAEAQSALVTIGIRPTWACPGYGYIERGKRIGRPEDPVAAFEVVRFREKPDSALAEKFLAQGHFCWNAGMFIWSVPSVLKEFAHHAPEFSTFIHEVIKAEDSLAVLHAQYGSLPAISIDYALMEKASRVLNIEATFDWDDVGNWLSLGKYLPADDLGNHHNAPTVALGARDNIIFSDEKLQIALLGVSNLIIVRTGDAILIASKDQAEQIKNLVGEIPENLL